MYSPKNSEKKNTSIHSLHHLMMGSYDCYHPSIQKLLQALFPNQSIEWKVNPSFHEIDTYIIIYLCSYDKTDQNFLIQAFEHAFDLLKSKKFKDDAKLLMIFYYDLKVAFPERKLQREKAMCALNAAQILNRTAHSYQNRLVITHEFGTHRLDDSLQYLTGKQIFIEARV